MQIYIKIRQRPLAKAVFVDLQKKRLFVNSWGQN